MSIKIFDFNMVPFKEVDAIEPGRKTIAVLVRSMRFRAGMFNELKSYTDRFHIYVVLLQ